MARKRVLGFLLGIATLGWLYSQSQQEKARVLKSLRANSQLLHTESGTIEYAVRGTGKPVLMLHGAGGGYDQGIALGEMLTGYQIIAVSRPGHRRTSLSVARTLAEQADAARLVLDHLGTEPVMVIGLSAGGLTALEFAIRHPDKCHSLVLLSAHGPSLKDNKPAAFWFWLLESMLSSDFLAWLMVKFASIFLIWLEGNTRAEMGSMLNRVLLDNVFPVSDWRDGTYNDLEQLLSLTDMPLEDIQVPTLIIHGVNDANVPYQVARDNAWRIRDSSLMTIEGGTHLMFASHYEEVGEAIMALLGR